MIQTVLSIGVAYERCGFIHLDLILGNVLFKKTKQETITYVFSSGKVELPTMGYKIVIMDFEKSLMNDTEYCGCNEKIGIIRFWRNVEMFIYNINAIETETHWIDTNVTYITTFINNMKKRNMTAENVVQIIPMIQEMKISFNIIQEKQIYNPNYFEK
jgi:hypothetical protein